ncbi:MAG: HPr family phosphocarrier protein [Planctomycetota bacterium]|jgi:phosphotransferase system HPr (HPr) family protein
MSQLKATRTVTVSNPEGLHARAATLVAELVGRLPAQITLVKGKQRVDGSDVLQMLSLAALQGEQLSIEATGENAEASLDAVVDLFDGKFGEHEPVKQHEHQAGGPRPSDADPDGPSPDP